MLHSQTTRSMQKHAQQYNSSTHHIQEQQSTWPFRGKGRGLDKCNIYGAFVSVIGDIFAKFYVDDPGS